jgi:hypothetical protein
VLTWQTSPATICQVQFKTNLLDANWIPLGNNILASGTTLSATNSNLGASQRFFRVVQLN